MPIVVDGRCVLLAKDVELPPKYSVSTDCTNKDTYMINSCRTADTHIKNTLPDPDSMCCPRNWIEITVQFAEGDKASAFPQLYQFLHQLCGKIMTVVHNTDSIRRFLKDIHVYSSYAHILEVELQDTKDLGKPHGPGFASPQARLYNNLRGTILLVPEPFEWHAIACELADKLIFRYMKANKQKVPWKGELVFEFCRQERAQPPLLLSRSKDWGQYNRAVCPKAGSHDDTISVPIGAVEFIKV
eukprot:TRINITY_DN67651_c4_g11_i1.p1 TRINITY_DN67651_c4_g11~~TRINITY_DN67651_c4_g11_i1.p1  ORF type:complete len:257 (-),score=1.65 TRINITY_DN67651_c4_g11_i1:172-900(-)